MNKETDNSETRYIGKAIVHYRKALDLCSTSESTFWFSWKLFSLVVILSSRQECAVLLQDALVLCPPGRSERATVLTSLGTLLSLRYKQLGGIDDVHKPILLDREVLELYRNIGICRQVLISLSSNPFMRYQMLGEMNDFGEDIVLAQVAMAISSQGHPDRILCLHCLAWYFYTRFAQPG